MTIPFLTDFIFGGETRIKTNGLAHCNRVKSFGGLINNSAFLLLSLLTGGICNVSFITKELVGDNALHGRPKMGTQTNSPFCFHSLSQTHPLVQLRENFSLQNRYTYPELLLCMVQGKEENKKRQTLSIYRFIIGHLYPLDCWISLPIRQLSCWGVTSKE